MGDEIGWYSCGPCRSLGIERTYSADTQSAFLGSSVEPPAAGDPAHCRSTREVRPIRPCFLDISQDAGDNRKENHLSHEFTPLRGAEDGLLGDRARTGMNSLLHHESTHFMIAQGIEATGL